MSDSIGEGTVLSEYKISTELITTATCNIYKAVHQYPSNQNDPTAVIKVLKETLILDPGYVSQFIAEGAILRTLCSEHKHKNIVFYRNHGKYGERPYVIMDFVSNRNLRNLINEKPPLTLAYLNRVVRYVHQAAYALQIVHSKRIIHNDIKPENLLLRDSDVEVVLCDFGHAIQLLPTEEQKELSLQDQKRDQTYRGPERFNCYASDQYALGRVTYELLGGDLSMQRSSITIEDWNEILKNWDAELFAPMSLRIGLILSKALSLFPDKRYKTVLEFANALVEEVQKYNVQSTSNLSTSENSNNIVQANDPTDTVAVLNPSSIAPIFPSALNLNQPDANQTKLITRRTFLAGLDVVTLGILGFSWVKLVPTISQAMIPRVVIRFVSPPSKPLPFGTIYDIYHGHTNNVNGVSWSQDNKQIASASYDGSVQVWNAINGVSNTNFMGDIGTTEPAYDVAWSFNGNNVASCSNSYDGKRHKVYIWVASNGNILSTSLARDDHKGLINAIAWSPDNSKIATASFDGTVKVWKADDGSLLQTYRGHTKGVYDVTWSPDNNRIASCSERSVHVWVALTGERKLTYGGHSDNILSVSWIPTRNGELIASSSVDQTVNIWSAITGNDEMPQKPFEAAVRKVRWSHNGKYLAAGTRSIGVVHVWEAATGSEVSPHPYNEKEQDKNINVIKVDINALAWSPDGTMIASGGTDKLVHVWSSGLTDAGK